MRSISEEQCGESITNCEWLKDDILYECEGCSEDHQQTENMQSCGKSIVNCASLDDTDTKKCKFCKQGKQHTDDLKQCGELIN